MADIGHKFTDAVIAQIERRLKLEYYSALKDMQKESTKFLKRFEKADKQMLKKLNANEITVQEYTEWRNRNILQTHRTEALIGELSERLTHTDEVAADIANGQVPKVYSENYNYATFDIENQSGINTNFSLMSEDAVSELIKGNTSMALRVDIPKDLAWNEKHIRSALTQGVLKGEAIPKIAKRLQKVTNMDRTAATRNARTLMTRSQNAGRMEGIKRAVELNLPVAKVWIATLDHRTRDSHVDLDSEVQKWDATFSNGMDYPGASGPPEEVYNCRCDMRPLYEGTKFDASNLDLRNTSHMEEASYEEWKNAHRVTRNENGRVVRAKGRRETK